MTAGTSPPDGHFAVERASRGPNDHLLRLSGSLSMNEAPAIWRELREATKALRRGRCDIDLSRATKVDGGMMSLLVALRADLAQQKVQATIVGTPEQFLPLVDPL